MNNPKLLTLIVTVLIYLEALALLSFPMPENLLVAEQEETDENLDEYESEELYEPPTTYRESNVHKRKSTPPPIDTTQRVTVPALAMRTLKCKVPYPPLPDVPDPEGSLEVFIDIPTGKSRAAKSIVRWIRSRFEETIYERDFTLEELISGWLTLMPKGKDFHRTIFPVYADRRHVTYRDSLLTPEATVYVTFSLPSGRILPKPILPKPQ